MAKNHPVPLRLDQEVRMELESLAAASGLSLSDLCRLAIEKFLDEVAVTGEVSLRVNERPAARYGSRPVHRSLRAPLGLPSDRPAEAGPGEGGSFGHGGSPSPPAALQPEDKAEQEPDFPL